MSDLGLLLIEQLLLLFDGVFLGGYLCLLFLDGIDQNGGDLSVLDAFDFAFIVARYKKGFNFLGILRSEADIAHSAVFPIESDRAQTSNNV